METLAHHPVTSKGTLHYHETAAVVALETAASQQEQGLEKTAVWALDAAETWALEAAAVWAREEAAAAWTRERAVATWTQEQ